MAILSSSSFCGLFWDPVTSQNSSLQSRQAVNNTPKRQRLDYNVPISGI